MSCSGGKAPKLSCGATTGLAVELINPASAADVVKSVVIGLVIDGTKCAVIGRTLTAEVTEGAVVRHAAEKCR